MATTALFAEILIIGLLTLFWVALAVVSLFGVPDLGGLKGWEVLAPVSVISLAYVLGIAADRLADSWSDGTDKKLWKKWGLPPANEMSRDELRLRLTASPSSLTWLDYARSRRRIARAAVLDAWLAGIVAAVLLLIPIHPLVHVSPGLLLVVLAVSALVAGASAFAWLQIGKTYFKLLSLAYLVQLGDTPPPLTKPDD